MNEQEALLNYVRQSSPEVNIILRTNNGNLEGKTFDGLFTIGDVPCPLYRIINNDYVIISEGNIITDPAYLSCTSDLDNVINHVDGTHIACLKIKIEAPLPHINVHKRLPNQNDEGEFILPRGSRLLLTGTTHYQEINGIQQFLYDERSLLGVNALMELYHINEITTYELTYLE